MNWLHKNKNLKKFLEYEINLIKNMGYYLIDLNDLEYQTSSIEIINNDNIKIGKLYLDKTNEDYLKTVIVDKPKKIKIYTNFNNHNHIFTSDIVINTNKCKFFIKYIEEPNKYARILIEENNNNMEFYVNHNGSLKIFTNKKNNLHLIEEMVILNLKHNHYFHQKKINDIIGNKSFIKEGYKQILNQVKNKYHPAKTKIVKEIFNDQFTSLQDISIINDNLYNTINCLKEEKHTINEMIYKFDNIWNGICNYMIESILSDEHKDKINKIISIKQNKLLIK